MICDLVLLRFGVPSPSFSPPPAQRRLVQILVYRPLTLPRGPGLQRLLFCRASAEPKQHKIVCGCGGQRGREGALQALRRGGAEGRHGALPGLKAAIDGQ